MSPRNRIVAACALCLALVFAAAPAGAVPAPAGPAALQAGIVANGGQLPSSAVYTARTTDCTAYFEPRSILFDKSPAREGQRGIALRVSFPHGTEAAGVEGADPLPGRVNVFGGSDPSRWRAGLAAFGEVRYRGIAAGSDLVYRMADGRLKYDCVVAPHADLARVALRYQGAERLEVDGQGALLIHTAAGVLYEQAPFLYQDVAGIRVPVRGGYRVSGRDLGFWATGYDAGLPLVVDPGVAWSTFLGGSSVDCLYGATTDSNGDVYVVGSTTSTNYPATTGAYQRTLRGGTDVIVTKLRSDGAAVLWSTLLGGTGNEVGRGIAVDAAGSVYVTGETTSSDFPVTAGAFRTQLAMAGANDGFVTKIAPGGGSLTYSTYLGGTGDDYPKAIAVDGSGAATVGGSTGSIDFPTTQGVVKPSRTNSIYDAADGFVSKLNAAGSGLVYSTYLGGAGGMDGIFGLALDTSGAAVVCGVTQSSDFPTTTGAFDRTYGGLRDGFVTRLGPGASSYVYSSYLGGNGLDEAHGICVDGQNNAIIVGYTASTDLPTTSGALRRAFAGGYYDGFAVKLPASGGPATYCTYLGGSGSDAAYAVGLLAGGSAVISCVTDGGTFPTTSGAYMNTYQGGAADGAVMQLSANGATLTYSSFLGSSGNDQIPTLAVSGSGRVMLAGYTDGATFPTTASAVRTAISGSGSDGFVTAFDLVAGAAAVWNTPPTALALSSPSPNPFLSTTQVALTSERPTLATVQVCDVQGRLVRTIARDQSVTGSSRWTWDGRDDQGAPLGAGVYLIRVVTPDGTSTRTVTRLR